MIEKLTIFLLLLPSKLEGNYGDYFCVHFNSSHLVASSLSLAFSCAHAHLLYLFFLSEKI